MKSSGDNTTGRSAAKTRSKSRAPQAARSASGASESDELAYFHPCVRQWFRENFAAPTPAQLQAWPAVATGKHVLLLAPTGSGKTLAAFLVAVNRLMFPDQDPRAAAEHVASTTRDVPKRNGVKVLYISPLKALGVDVERNLRPPLTGVRAVAERMSQPVQFPSIAIRSGDTPSRERQEMLRRPPDVLITTPESLYLMLTSRARETLASVDTIIIDEIHSLVNTKRGAHLFASLERLEGLRRREDPSRPPAQRLGLSATQRPLDEVAALLGGSEVDASPDALPRPRDVEILNIGRATSLDLTIEMPAEDLAAEAVERTEAEREAEVVFGRDRPADESENASAPDLLAQFDGGGRLGEGGSAAGPAVSSSSIWPSIYPLLVEEIRSHRSTMLFANSRRLAERLAAAINEVANEELALAHHGSIAKDTRRLIEDRLKSGDLPAIVATSSLELGIDMGAVDLVIQIESPPSIAAGIQRIGRAGHGVGQRSKGVIFPKYRGDLLACAAAVKRMHSGEVEATYYPRNPLDVLAQQIVAMVSEGPQEVEEVFATMRRAAPFRELPRASFEAVLDLLSGRYPSDEFSELRARIDWDRLKGRLNPRRGTQRVAVLNAGTIPDRGLYGVFLVGEGGQSGSRVGELDEEMVYETRPGDVILLGASSWRVQEILQDRVLVVPAPGEPGKMPFWRGDGPGRPLEFGEAIGRYTRWLSELEPEPARQHLLEQGLSEPAADRLIRYLAEQREATEIIPCDRTIVVESFLDEIGDWRVAILSPFGTRVHAPWATAVTARLRETTAGEVDSTWTDDGMVFRLPGADQPPELHLFLLQPDEVEDIVIRELANTALFAARFRENAARALLLPRQNPGRRTPLWLQRRKAADLLRVAARYREFPILLETYRECLRDVFDLNGLKRILADIQRRKIRVHWAETTSASPFATSLMFSYTANFLYQGDVPLAERRAQSLALDHAQLRELLGDAEMRELLDAEAIDEVAAQLQWRTETRRLRDAEAVHDALRHLGDLSFDELLERCVADADSNRLAQWLEQLQRERKVISVRIAGDDRFAAAEDAGRLRDALGTLPPPGLPGAFLEPVANPLTDLVARFARTHIPFRDQEVSARLGVPAGPVRQTLAELVAQGRVVEGEFLPGGVGHEWCDAEVLRTLKRKSLARLRAQVEPVEPSAFARFLTQWHGIRRPGRGLDAVLDSIEQLQGLALPASVLEDEILPARIHEYRPAMLDELCAAGEIVWRGVDAMAGRDGRVSLYLTDAFDHLAVGPDEPEEAAARQIRDLLAERGAIFFSDITRELGGFPNDVVESLWDLVWAGIVTNDTLTPLRSLRRASAKKSGNRKRRSNFRTRRSERLPGTEGRWSLLPNAFPGDATSRADGPGPSSTERLTALANQLLQRYGIVTRSAVLAEGVSGGFSSLYPVYKVMEESGKIRRGYFIDGLGGLQFALPGADDRLREPLDVSGGRPGQSEPEDELPAGSILAATDPANPWGTVVPWPRTDDESNRRLQRVVGARVVLHEGRLLAYLARSTNQLTTFLRTEEPERTEDVRQLASILAALARRHPPLLIPTIDGQFPTESSLLAGFLTAGFTATHDGLLHRGRGRG